LQRQATIVSLEPASKSAVTVKTIRRKIISEFSSTAPSGLLWRYIGSRKGGIGWMPLATVDLLAEPR